MKAFTFLGLVVTTCKQPGGAPLCDRAWTRELNGNREWQSIAILLTPWAKDQYGQHKPQRALVIGVKKR